MRFEFRIGPYTSAFLPSPEEVSVEAAVWWALEQPFAKSKGTDRIGRPVSEKLELSSSGDNDDSSDGGSSGAVRASRVAREAIKYFIAHRKRAICRNHIVSLPTVG
jgi:hypothetical protein